MAETHATTTPKLSLTERISYGMGDMGTSLAYNAASGFLLFFYTNVIGLPAAAIGTVFLVARLLDAVIDILVGIAVDKTRSRWGRTRPYFLFTAVPYALFTIAIFYMPDWSQNAQIAYAFLTFKGLGILMSVQSIPYTALMPMMTTDTGQRLKLSGMRSVGTSVSVVLGTAATMPLVGLFGGNDARRGFLSVGILFAAIGLIATIALFKNCKERVEDNASPSFAIGPAIAQMLRNRAWWIVFASCLLYFIRFGLMMSSTVYFAIEVLRQPWMISVLLPAVAGMLLLSAFVAPPILARTGIRKGGASVLFMAMLLFALLPLCEGNTTLFLIIYFAACLVTSITITAAFTMVAETVDYHEWQFGVRQEGLLSAGISLATKVGMAIGTAGVAYMLAFAEYDAAIVSDGARSAIRWTYYGGSIVLLGVQALLFLAWPMDRLRPQIDADLAARRS